VISLLLLSLACSSYKYVRVGVIDIIDVYTCSIQLDTEETIQVKSSFCKGLKEGDIIKAKSRK